MHLRYGWDARTKVIACTTREVCEEICNRMILHFHIIANMGFWFLVMTGPADEFKRTKRVQGWSCQIMEGRLLLFAILLLCEITTSFV